MRPDIIVGWMYHGCLVAQLVKIFSCSRALVLWSIHYSTASLSGEKALTAAVIRACVVLSPLPSKIIFVSHDGQSKHRQLGFRVKDSCVIPNGIDVDEFAPSVEARVSVRNELRLPVDAVLIGTVGRSHPLKDQPNFLRAAALLTRKHPDAHFLLAGPGVDANDDLRRLIDEFGLARRTHLLGQHDNVSRTLAALDVFSLSSYCESFPTVIGEAMACGVPSVVTCVGDAALIVGDTGQLVPPHNATALADSWSRLLDAGQEQRAAMGRAARCRVRELFPFEAIAMNYEIQFLAATTEKFSTSRWAGRGNRAVEHKIRDAAQPIIKSE